MSKFQFAGSMVGRSKNEVDRYGTKESGMRTMCGGWEGMICTRVWYDRDKERDRFQVWLTPHWQDTGKDVLLAEGILNHKIDTPFVVPALFA